MRIIVQMDQEHDATVVVAYLKALLAREGVVRMENLEISSETVEQPIEWTDYLVFDMKVSDFSPIVKGTKITSTEVVSRIIDGQSWKDVLKIRPELGKNDIRACLHYSIEEEGLAAHYLEKGKIDGRRQANCRHSRPQETRKTQRSLGRVYGNLAEEHYHSGINDNRQEAY